MQNLNTILKGEKITPIILTLSNIIEEQQLKIVELKEEVELLKKEVLLFKKETIKPIIKPSVLNNDTMEEKNPTKRTSTKGIPKRIKNIEVHEEKEITPQDLPTDAIFIQYYEIIVQDLEIKPHNIKYKLAQYKTKDGKVITAKLPANLHTKHYGNSLCTFILYQYHHQHVTQPLILEELRDMGIEISSGQLNKIITENLEIFHDEKDEILKAGLQNSDYIQTDDTGARHDGKNGYCTQIGNEFFTWFESTESKSRINFLELLSKGVDKQLFTFNFLSFEYMDRQKLPYKYYSKLENIDINITDKDTFEKWLEENEITGKKNIKIITEAALIGGLTEQGIPAGLSILSDGARQFNVFRHANCWVHAERNVHRLIPLTEENKQLVKDARKDIWDFYQKLREYKLNPAEEMIAILNDEFDVFSTKVTGYTNLDKAIEGFKKNKDDLLRVLTNPNIPLHNNLSEQDIRDYVKKRKISGSTRSEEGRRARDTFASLKKTCRKLGISFFNYLKDRLSRQGKIEPLGDKIVVAIDNSS